MKEAYTAKDLAEILGVSRIAVLKRSQRDKWQFEEKNGNGGKTKHYLLSSLPPDIQKKIVESEKITHADPLPTLATEAQISYYLKLSKELPPKDHTAEIDAFDGLPDWKKQEAYHWLSVIEKFNDYAATGPKRRIDAIQRFTLRYRIDHTDEAHFSWQTLYRKVELFRRQGLMGLTSDYGKTRNFADWTDEAKAFVRQKFLNINKPTMSWCYEELSLEAKKRQWQIPSQHTVMRFLAAIPEERKSFWREGEKNWEKKFFPSILRDYKSMYPGEMWVADHEQINVAVKHPSGRIIFPWFTGWKDMRTRKILGWTLANIPSSDTINISLKYSIEKYGVPQHVVIDNGRDFSSRHFAGGQKRFRVTFDENEALGIFSLLDVTAHFCIPANAQAKNIERWFWTQEQSFQRAFPTYRGINTVARPEGLQGRIIKDAIAWDKLNNDLANYVANYNQDHAHRGHGMDGRSPNEVWNEYFQANAMRRAAPSSLRLLLMKSKQVKIGRFGIEAFGSNYRSDEVMDHQREWVIYRYDPQDLSQLYVYTLKNEFFCLAKQQIRTAWNDENAYAENQKLKKRRKILIRSQREVDAQLAKVEFGYTMREPSGEHPDREQKVYRLLKTPLDYVPRQIEAEKQEMAAAANSNFRESINQMLDRQIQEKRAQEEKKYTPGGGFMKLTMFDHKNFDEEEI